MTKEVEKSHTMKMGPESIYQSLDSMIDQDNRHKYHESTNVNELKDKIEKYKIRNERFANDEDADQRREKIQRMEKKLEWTVHKAAPVPILAGSNMLGDSLYIYGVDFMSTDDVKKYFSRYSKLSDQAEVDEETFKIIWINDSSCVVKLPSDALAGKAYLELKLSEPRVDDQLPPLNIYLQDLKEWEAKKQAEKVLNPDYEDLFAEAPVVKEVKVAEEETQIDTRNYEYGTGFIDVMGYKIVNMRGESW